MTTHRGSSNVSSSRAGRSWARFGWLIFLGGAAICAGLLAVWGRFAAPAEIGTVLAAARPWLSLWRAALWVVLIGGWPYAVALLGRHAGWSPDHRAWMQGLRWRIAAWLLVIELVLVQGVAGRFLNGGLGP